MNYLAKLNLDLLAEMKDKYRELLYGFLIFSLIFLWIPFVSAQSCYAIDTDLRANADINAQQLDNFIKSVHPDSPLIGLGQSWIDAGNKYGINPVYLMSHAMHETGWGLKNSYLVNTKHNLYGYTAYDRNPDVDAMSFSTWEEGIDFVAGKIKNNYLNDGGIYFHKEYGSTLQGMNINYATDSNWATSISNVMNMFTNWLGECPESFNYEEKYIIDQAFQWPVDLNDRVPICYKYYKDCDGKINGHTGIDISPRSGNPDVHAVAYGKISTVVKNDVGCASNCEGKGKGCNDHGFGNAVIIEHKLENGDTLYSMYAHLDSINENIKKGEYVNSHDTIGKMGASGYGQNDYWIKPCTQNKNAHLHFEIKDSNTLFNPSGKCTDCVFGYADGNPDDYGYHNPEDYFGRDKFKSWEFNVAGDIEGWELHNVEGTKYSVGDGSLFIDPSESDPWIENNGLSIDATANVIKTKMSSNCVDNIGAIYFTTAESPSYSDIKKVEFKIITGPEWHNYNVLMNGNIFWKGTITGLRIDPANNCKSNTNEDTVGFDYIRVEQQVDNIETDKLIKSTISILEKVINEFINILKELGK